MGAWRVPHSSPLLRVCAWADAAVLETRSSWRAQPTWWCYTLRCSVGLPARLPADESDLTTRMEVIVTLFLALTGI